MFELIVAGFMFVALVFYAVTGDADYGAACGFARDRAARRCAKRRHRTGHRTDLGGGPRMANTHRVILLQPFAGIRAIMTALNIPFTLMLIGIVLRGSAFIFRKYDIKSHEVKQGWSLCSVRPSFFTPFIQGVVLGALSTGQIRTPDGRVVSGFFAGWLTPFAFACGLFALALFAFSSGDLSYGRPSTESHVQNDFRLRALCSGAALAADCFCCFHHLEGRRPGNVSR